MSFARLDRLGASQCIRPISGSSPIPIRAMRHSDSQSAWIRFMQAFGGFAARRGLCVNGEMREPKNFQCAATRPSSLRGQRIGTSAHWLQNAFAALASTSLTASILFNSASSALNRRITSAATELPNMSRTIAAWPSSFCEMSSLQIFRAIPFSRARDCALRSLTSLGAVGRAARGNP